MADGFRIGTGFFLAGIFLSLALLFVVALPQTMTWLEAARKPRAQGNPTFCDSWNGKG